MINSKNNSQPFTYTIIELERKDTLLHEKQSIESIFSISITKGKTMSTQAFFEGLVVDEQESLVTTAFVGGEAHYVVDDQGFLRHIDAEQVDRQVLTFFVDQLRNNKDLAVSQALNFLGKDDLFTKAALDSSIENVEINEIMRQGIPAQARHMLGMMGFRIVINHHGDIVDMRQPEMPYDEE